MLNLLKIERVLDLSRKSENFDEKQNKNVDNCLMKRSVKINIEGKLLLSINSSDWTMLI